MDRRLCRCAWIALALATLLLPAQIAWAEDHDSDAEEPEAEQAEPEEEWVAKWSSGFKIEKGDDFKFGFGGRIMADYTFADADDTVETAYGAGEFENGFEFRRARVFVQGEFYERFKFKAQYEFAGGAEIRDLYIALGLDFGDLRFGHYKEYFSLEELTSSKYLAFLERSLPVDAFSPAFNSGIGAHGSRGDTFNWGVGAFYDSDEFGVTTSEDDVNLTGRVGFRPLYEDGGKRLVHLGLGVNHRNREDSIRFRARPEAHLTTRLVDTGTFQADSALILGAEAAGVFGRFWFAGEYIQADVDSPGFRDPTFDGAYVQAGYYLTDDHRRFKTSDGAFSRQKPNSPWNSEGGRGAWEIVARFSTIDLSDGAIDGLEQDDLTIGLNWYPNPVTRLMINFVTADVDGVGDANYALVRWQVDF